MTKPQIPHNIKAEEALLGSLIIDPSTYYQARDVVSAADFYIVKNGWIFSAVTALQEQSKPIDLLTLSSELEKAGRFEEVGGAAYITTLMNAVPSALHAGAYASEVADKSNRRQLLVHASGLAKAAYNESLDPGASAARLAGELLRLGKPTGDTATTTEALTEFYDKVEGWTNSPLGPGEVRGLATGLRSLDKQFGGLETGLYILAGRAHMGKSATAIQVAANIAAAGERVLYFTLEMTAEQLIGRVVCARARVLWRDVKRGAVFEKYPAFVREMGVVSEWPLLINDASSPNPQQVTAEVHREMTRGGLALVIVDYLGLMTGGEGENRHQRLGDIARQMKVLAKDTDTPVLLLHQVGRSVEHRANKRPLLADLFESGQLEMHADVVMFCYRDAYYYDDCESPRVMELITRKDRLTGSLGTAEVHLGEYAEVKNLERRER